MSRACLFLLAVESLKRYDIFEKAQKLSLIFNQTEKGAVSLHFSSPDSSCLMPQQLFLNNPALAHTLPKLPSKALH